MAFKRNGKLVEIIGLYPEGEVFASSRPVYVDFAEYDERHHWTGKFWSGKIPTDRLFIMAVAEGFLKEGQEK